MAIYCTTVPFFHPTKNLFVLLIFRSRRTGPNPECLFAVIDTSLLNGCFTAVRERYIEFPVYHVGVLPRAFLILIIYKIPEAFLWFQGAACAASEIA